MTTGPTLSDFITSVMSFIEQWDGRSTPTPEEVERITQWYDESHHCCPEAIAADIRFVYPTAEEMRSLTNYQYSACR